LPFSGHCFSLTVIQKSLQVIVEARLSLRSTQAVWEVFEAFFGRAAGFSTIRLWAYRVGMYLWRRTPPRHDDWIWILDHVAEDGHGKCLLIVGVRRSALRAGQFQLTHHDVTVLYAEVMETSTGKAIHEILSRLAEVAGVPQQVVSDHGSDVLKGERLFQADHPETRLTWDITHRLARLWLAATRDDERWKAYRAQCGRTRTQTQRTDLAFLSPPSQSGATRCEYFDELTLWGEKLLDYYDQGDFCQVNASHVWDEAAESQTDLSPGISAKLQSLRDHVFADRASFVGAVEQAVGDEALVGAEVDVAAIVKAADRGRRDFVDRFGWVEDFRSELQEIYVPLVRMGYWAEERVKSEGFHTATGRRWLASVPGPWLQHRRAEQFAKQLLGYLHEEGADRAPTEALLGTSDVLESLFGKYKQYSGRGPSRELGASLLLLPLCTVDLTTELVSQALLSMSTKVFTPLKRVIFGESTLSQRRLAFSSLGDTKPA